VPPETPARPRIFLIDTMGFIFRAYHAMARTRPMSNNAGVPTGATFVFVNMINKLRQDFAPDYLAAVYDLSGPLIRDEQAKAITNVRKYDAKTKSYVDTEYAGYKATRAETPPDLIQQFPYIRRALEAYRIPILESQGYEADDVIGTLAHKAAAQGLDVFVVSNDKDMMQLVNERIRILNPAKDNLVLDEAKVEEVLGVPPRQVIDVMALRGDSIDNIPGAPGIGDKGSVDLIKKFGSVEAALDRADEVERKSYRESLKENRSVVLESKKLVTIDTNVPVEFHLESMKPLPQDLEASRALFAELGFNTLLRAALDSGEPETKAPQREWKHGDSAKEVEALVKQINKDGLIFLVSVSNTKENKDNKQSSFAGSGSSTMVALCGKDGAGIVASLAELPEPMKVLLEDEAVPKSVHDAKAATHLLAEHGINMQGVAHDPMLYAYLLDPTYNSYSLDDLALRRMNVKLSGSAEEAAEATAHLAEELRALIDKKDHAALRKLYYEMDLPLVPVLARMESAGVKLDVGILKKMSTELGKQVDALAKQIHDHAEEEFNINSPKQLAEVLFTKLALPMPGRRGKAGAVSTAVDVLEEISHLHPVPKLVLEYRQLSKLKSTYVDALPELVRSSTGRLHTTFNAAATATGRLSSTDPNLQNIPIRTEVGRSIRAAFTAEPGCVLVAADYSQIELRLLAHFSGDKLLTDAFRRGDDIHTLTASEVFGVPPMMMDDEHRRRAKAVNFGIVYGLSAFGLAQQLGIEQKEAKKYIDGYFARYTSVKLWIESTLEAARKDGYVTTLFGRVRPIPDILAKNPNQRGFAERTAVNTPLQGTAADLMRMAMIKMDAEITQRNLKSRMTLQVHDELVFECPEKEAEKIKELAKEVMENIHKLNVPLVLDVCVGKNWRDME